MREAINYTQKIYFLKIQISFFLWFFLSREKNSYIHSLKDLFVGEGGNAHSNIKIYPLLQTCKL